MAPLLFKNVKFGRSFTCSSTSSIAVCKSIDNRSIIQPITGRDRDQYTPHLSDPYRTAKFQPTSKLKPLNQKDTNRRSSAKPVESSRFKVEGSAFIDIFPNTEQVPQWVSTESVKPRGSRSTELPIFQPYVPDISEDQVVALRVSLHCIGCAGKVRKHLSKMQGVTSFSIDWKTKKVMVRGNVTPLSVLNSISKVKNVELWQSPPRASICASRNNAQFYHSPPRASAYF